MGTASGFSKRSLCPCSLLQDLLPSLCSGALQLGHMAEAVELQGGPHPFEQLPPADLALYVPYVFTRIAGKRSVIAASG